MSPSAHDYVFAVLPAADVPAYGFHTGALVYIAPVEWFDAEDALYEEPLEGELEEVLGASFGQWFSELTEGVFESDLADDEARNRLLGMGLIESSAFVSLVRSLEGLDETVAVDEPAQEPADASQRGIPAEWDPSPSAETLNELTQAPKAIARGERRQYSETNPLARLPTAEQEDAQRSDPEAFDLGEPWGQR